MKTRGATLTVLFLCAFAVPACAQNVVKKDDDTLKAEIAAFNASGKAKADYERLVRAFEAAELLNVDESPEGLEKALTASIGKSGEGCRNLGLALTERMHLRAAQYLAEVHCEPQSQKQLQRYQKPVKKKALEDMPNIDG